MEFNEYQKRALCTMKPWATKKDQVINGLLGLAGESGEVCELLKHHFVKGTELDMTAFKKELDDIMWYIAELCDAYGFTMEEVAQLNLDKLAARYGKKFCNNENREGLAE